ncbi:uncharacterized protein LOC121946873 [Plectropomus leopardus]|uniref:uncharacterized protein LOC121946873 n=1 Tax=Plectropomus leopardus TaxID=160734 RepID=UPI001C4D84AB|nr:uncharacterized protein LOC121946873 [Plectropomus leopardus]
MSSFPSVCKTLHVSPSSREHVCDPVGLIFSQGGCLTHDHGQMLGPELGLMEMSESEYSHFQHLIQAHVEAHNATSNLPDARSQPSTEMVKDTIVISPLSSTQAIDLSSSTDDHSLVMPGEKTPTSYGEVPSFVLARVRGEDSPTGPPTNCSQKRPISAARVCLVKRFDTMCADASSQQDTQSAVLSNSLTTLQQSAEAQEAVRQLQLQKWMKTDRVIGHMPHIVEPNKQRLIIPNGILFNFCPERVFTKTHYTSGSNSTGEQQLDTIGNDVAIPTASGKHGGTHGPQPVKAAPAAPDSAGESRSSTSKRARSHMLLIQRRERHNSKERERRKRIRSYCDELNMLVPFCESDTDKVTTLKWTTTFLRYISETYGNAFRQEFQKTFTNGKRHVLKSSLSLGQFQVSLEMDETLSTPHVVEQ